MSNQIFQSCLNLKFKEESIQSEFQKLKENKINKYSKYLLFFNLLITTGMTIFCIYNLWNIIQLSNLNKLLFISSLFSNFIIFIIFILNFFRKLVPYRKLFLYLTFIIITFVHHDTRMIINKILQKSSLNILMIFIELILRLAGPFFIKHSFCECLIINLISMLSLWIIYPIFMNSDDFTTTFLNLIYYNIGICILIVFSYFLDKHYKILFYYFHQAELKSKKLEILFDKINSGYIIFRGDKLEYVNTHLLKQMDKTQIKKDFLPNRFTKINSDGSESK
jgi:hypothetical protein